MQSQDYEIKGYVEAIWGDCLKPGKKRRDAVLPTLQDLPKTLSLKSERCGSDTAGAQTFSCQWFATPTCPQEVKLIHFIITLT